MPQSKGSSRSRRTGTQTRASVSFWWAVSSAVGILLGASGPWAVAATASSNDTSSKTHVWLVVIAAAVALLVLLRFRRRSKNSSLWLCSLAGLFSAAVTIYERHRLTITTHSGGAVTRVPSQIDWGLNLTTVASISLVIAAVTLAAITSARVAVAVFVLTGKADGADPGRIGLLRDLADLRDRGALTDEEFANEKTRLLIN